MGAITFAVGRGMRRFFLVPKEAMHVPREPVLQSAKVVLTIAQEMACRASVRVRGMETLVFADVPRAVLLVEDEVPSGVSTA
jgi:hypothetical protein